MRRTGLIAVVAAALTAPAAAQRPATVELPGGTAEALPDGEYYVGTPREAVPQPGTACVLAKRYLDLVNAGRYAEVPTLYAVDAVVLEPMGGLQRGRAALEAFYTRQIGAMRPHLIGVAYVGTATECMVDIAARLRPATRYSLSSVDHFTVNAAGKATRMIAFGRPRGKLTPLRTPAPDRSPPAAPPR